MSLVDTQSRTATRPRPDHTVLVCTLLTALLAGLAAAVFLVPRAQSLQARGGVVEATVTGETFRGCSERYPSRTRRSFVTPVQYEHEGVQRSGEALYLTDYTLPGDSSRESDVMLPRVGSTLSIQVDEDGDIAPQSDTWSAVGFAIAVAAVAGAGLGALLGALLHWRRRT